MGVWMKHVVVTHCDLQFFVTHRERKCSEKVDGAKRWDGSYHEVSSKVAEDH